MITVIGASGGRHGGLVVGRLEYYLWRHLRYPSRVHSCGEDVLLVVWGDAAIGMGSTTLAATLDTMVRIDLARQKMNFVQVL